MEELNDYTTRQLREIAEDRNVTLPKKGQGSGSRGNILKLDIIRALTASVFVAQPLSIYSPPKFKSSKLGPSTSEWDICTQSPENADRCIQNLYLRYPALMKPCKTMVPGPAAAVVTDGDKIIGVATPKGEIKALSEPIPTSSLPPPPPPPPPPLGMPPPPPPPPPMPIVKVSAIPGAKKALKEEVREQKTNGNVVDASALQDQLKELRAVVKEEKAAEDDWRALIRERPQLKRVDVDAVEKERLQRQKERELAEDPMARHLAAIQEGPRLKKVDIEAVEAEREKAREERAREKEGPRDKMYREIKEGPKLRKAGSCGYNMIWDPRLRKCVAVDPELSGEDVEKAIGMSIARLENDGCIIC
uniref:WH2 domain-containing protein n=1 Tax=Marseillevirus LCMAC101 TaxID=2506602 RepID=A0A481YSI7_9VIRU|nr:MAG: hypothetical protein LCMAC101_07730 [Marseillevirus LCMAC101]